MNPHRQYLLLDNRHFTINEGTVARELHIEALQGLSQMANIFTIDEDGREEGRK